MICPHKNISRNNLWEEISDKLPTNVLAALHSMDDVDLYVSLLGGLNPNFFGNVSLKDELALINCSKTYQQIVYNHSLDEIHLNSMNMHSFILI